MINLERTCSIFGILGGGNHFFDSQKARGNEIQDFCVENGENLRRNMETNERYILDQS